MNGGLCKNGSDAFDFKCFCTDSWTGVRCEEYVSKNVSQTNFIFDFTSD